VTSWYKVLSSLNAIVSWDRTRLRKGTTAETQTLCASPEKKMNDLLTSEDKELIEGTNFLRRSNEFHGAMKLVAIVLVLGFFASPYMGPKNKPKDWTPPTTFNEYLSNLKEPYSLVPLIVASPLLCGLVIPNWIIKIFELNRGTKTRKRFRVIFRANSRQIKIILFWPFYFIIYKRHGGLVNLKKGETVDIERTALGRMLRFSKV